MTHAPRLLDVGVRVTASGLGHPRWYDLVSRRVVEVAVGVDAAGRRCVLGEPTACLKGGTIVKEGLRDLLDVLVSDEGRARPGKVLTARVPFAETVRLVGGRHVLTVHDLVRREEVTATVELHDGVWKVVGRSSRGMATGRPVPDDEGSLSNAELVAYAPVPEVRSVHDVGSVLLARNAELAVRARELAETAVRLSDGLGGRSVAFPYETTVRGGLDVTVGADGRSDAVTVVVTEPVRLEEEDELLRPGFVYDTKGTRRSCNPDWHRLDGRSAWRVWLTWLDREASTAVQDVVVAGSLGRHVEIAAIYRETEMLKAERDAGLERARSLGLSMPGAWKGRVESADAAV